jgi:hypothetical protein
VTVSSVGTPTLAVTSGSQSPSVTAAWGTGQTRAAGDLLVAVLAIYGTSTSGNGATPSGWTLRASAGSVGSTLYYYSKVATGSDTAPAFSSTTTGTAADAQIVAILYDLSDSSGGTPALTVDGTNSGTTGGSTSVQVSGTSYALQPGGLAIAGALAGQGTTTATTAWTTPSNWTLNADQTATAQSQTAFYSTTNSTVLAQYASPVVTLTASRTTTSVVGILILAGIPVAGNTGSLNDNFPGSSLSASKWYVNSGAITGTQTVSGNQVTLALPIEASGAGYYNFFTSAQAYDLTGSCAVIQLVSCTTGVTSFYADFFLQFGSDAFALAWEINDAVTTTINAIYSEDYSETNVYSATYVAATYKWLMIDNFVPGTITWRYSANGINWTTAGTVAVSTISTDINIQALEVQFQGATDTILGTASSVVWANFNNPPVLPPRHNQVFHSVQSASVY